MLDIIWQSREKKSPPLIVWIMWLVLCISFKVSHQTTQSNIIPWVSVWSAHIHNNLGFSEEQYNGFGVD